MNRWYPPQSGRPPGRPRHTAWASVDTIGKTAVEEARSTKHAVAQLESHPFPIEITQTVFESNQINSNSTYSMKKRL